MEGLEYIHAGILLAPFALIAALLSIPRKDKFVVSFHQRRDGIDRKPFKYCDSIICDSTSLLSVLKEHGVKKRYSAVLCDGKPIIQDVDQAYLDTIVSSQTFRFRSDSRNHFKTMFDDVTLYDHYYCTIKPVKGKRR